MFKPLAVLMSAAMLSLGATAASAQVSVKVGHGGVEVKVGERSERKDHGKRDDNRRDNDKRDNDRRDNDRGVGQNRVWVEDYAMVEETYQEAGHYENRERRVWIEEQKVTVTERVYVAESHYTVEEQVYVAGQHVTKQVAHRGRHGTITYTEECVWVPAHYECRQVEKCRPAHYECRDVVKCVPGHYETVCQRVWVEGCTKTRCVKKCIGGHWEVQGGCR